MPDDIEAYRYATELVNVLKSANWDARGPEDHDDIRRHQIDGHQCLRRAAGRSDTTKILLTGLAKFGIPYQSRVPPSEALPDNQTVELFIGAKPSPPTAPGSWGSRGEKPGTREHIGTLNEVSARSRGHGHSDRCVRLPTAGIGEDRNRLLPLESTATSVMAGRKSRN